VLGGGRSIQSRSEPQNCELGARKLDPQPPGLPDSYSRDILGTVSDLLNTWATGSATEKVCSLAEVIFATVRFRFPHAHEERRPVKDRSPSRRALACASSRLGRANVFRVVFGLEVRVMNSRV